METAAKKRVISYRKQERGAMSTILAGDDVKMFHDVPEDSIQT